jgi:hypothetical protein
MCPNREALLAILSSASLAAACAHASAAPVRYLDIVNASYDSVTSVAVAAAGDAGFRELMMGAPLRGGTTSTTIELPPDGGCLRDLRVAFADGRTLLYPRIDVCRHGRLRLTARDGG